jgi:hypothetical protein
MPMIPYNTDLTRALKWQQNNAPNLQSIINSKAAWYQRYQNGFWTNWQTNVFDIRTANSFGLVVWCIILGVPLDLFNFEPLTNEWAYGAQRGNYLDGGGNTLPLTFTSGPFIYVAGVLVPSTNYTFSAATGALDFTAGNAPANGAVCTWKGTVTQNETGQSLEVQEPRIFGTGNGSNLDFNLLPSDAGNYNETGNNFYGGGSDNVSILSEVRWACQLRYVALVSNGRQQWINQMLNYIFNGGNPWNFPGKVYFYLTDNTMAQGVPNISNISANGVTVNPLTYTVNESAETVTFSTAPANGAALTWSGVMNWQPASNLAFGTGNGTTVTFALSNPPGGARPVTQSNYMEYRIGANMGISAALLNIMNTPSYGIMPQCAGIKYAVVQET